MDEAALQAAYEEARDAHEADPSQESWAAMHAAADAFARARYQRKVVEADDPNHPRGHGLPTVIAEGGEG